MPYQVLLYYLFTEIADPESFAAEHRALCQELGLLGRILIANEGINGTVSGHAESCSRYRESLASIPGFEDIEFKIDASDSHAFQKLFVRVRPEIISIHRELSGSVKSDAAPRLEPEEWREMMERDDVILLDGRNDYESELGRFENAVCPPVENFRDIPDWIEANRNLFEGKTVLTYCTGGIRCEKLSVWMKQAGFKSVYQLHGGICNYAQNKNTQGDKFLGVNVVFDDRVTISAGARSVIDTKCRECSVITSNYVNCANVVCNIRLILCPDCELSTSRCCSDACRSAARLRLKGLKLSASSFVSVK